MAAGYSDRLRVEGLALAGLGAAASVALVALVPASRRWPLNTVGQLLLAGALIDGLGTRSVRRYVDSAEPVEPGEEGSGEPTPLWHLPPLVAGLAAVFVLLPRTGLPGGYLAGWDAALRVTAGCTLVGLEQALRWAPIVAADEGARGRRYVRLPGSRLGRGTRLGFTRR